MTWHRKIPGQAACGPCCGIKEKLQTLWDRTINSILRINQVEPDDQGNIRITSGSEALTVSEGTNEIILDLDTSQLPAAVVQSVNGQTGAVILDAGDISTVGGDVQSDIQDLANDISGNTAAISAEALARQNADTALQNNINALQASIPQEAADAVAADPTVQSFAAAAADIPNKVDKRTGSGLRAYTHTGSTQDDTPVIDGTTGTTIPIRDSNGRLHAADPAAGATDKTLVTANWVSQTGDSAPNNLAHRYGNETYAGNKTFTGNTVFNTNPKVITPMGGSYIKQVTDFSHNARPANNTALRLIQINDNNGQYIARLNVTADANGNLRLRFEGYVIDGNGDRIVKSVDVATLTV